MGAIVVRHEDVWLEVVAPMPVDGDVRHSRCERTPHSGQLLVDAIRRAMRRQADRSGGRRLRLGEYPLPGDDGEAPAGDEHDLPYSTDENNTPPPSPAPEE